MTQDMERPYVELITGPNGLPRGCLVYKSQRLPLSLTKYAIVSSLLDPDGLNIETVSERRSALQAMRIQLEICNKFVSQGSLRAVLTYLRRDLKDFSPELIIPNGTHGLTGLRLEVKKEIDEVYQKKENPETGISIIRDASKRLCIHNGNTMHSIVVSTFKSSLIMQAASPAGLTWDFFKSAAELSGNNKVSLMSYKGTLSYLRRLLKAAGTTLTKRNNVRPADKKQPVYLVPLPPRETDTRTTPATALFPGSRASI